MAQQTLINTVTFPDASLLEAVGPLPSGLQAGVWDLQGPPRGIAAADIEAVILPYAAGTDWGALKDLPRLKLVHTQSTGYDGLPELVGPDVAVVSAAGVHAAATAELAVGLTLASLRGVDQMVRDQPKAVWNSVRRQSLADSRVLLVGVGGIGREIARRLQPFEVELTRVGNTARVDAEGQVHGADELTALAAKCDDMIVITPLNDSTHQLIDAGVLAAMPDGALLVNAARGVVVDTDALLAELASGRLRAALDVTDPEPLPAGHPLWGAPNLLLTPHLAGTVPATRARVEATVLQQLQRVLDGERLLDLVDAY